MRSEIQLQSLHALHAGEATAEPYLWPLFFRIDEQAYAAGLRAALQEGEVTELELKARGLDRRAIEAVPRGEDWFVAPGGSHGNLPAMRTGETAPIDRSFSAELSLGQGILHPAHAVIGSVAILWEEDTYPGHAKVDKAYTSFAEATRRLLEKAVRSSIKAQKGGSGRFHFGLRSAEFIGRSDSWDADKLDYIDLEDKRVPQLVRLGRLPDAPLEPGALEREMGRRFQDFWKVPLIDGDDFIGALFWARTMGELHASGPEELKKLWTPTTGSREGSWELLLRAGLAGG